MLNIFVSGSSGTHTSISHFASSLQVSDREDQLSPEGEAGPGLNPGEGIRQEDTALGQKRDR